jgi:hypothetical protein
MPDQFSKAWRDRKAGAYCPNVVVRQFPMTSIMHIRSNIRRATSRWVRSNSLSNNARTWHPSQMKWGTGTFAGYCKPLPLGNRVRKGGPARMQCPWYTVPHGRAQRPSVKGKPDVRKSQTYSGSSRVVKPRSQPVQSFNLGPDPKWGVTRGKFVHSRVG